MKVENITITYWNKNILKWINLEITKWDFVFLIWNSWSWKTSFIKCLIWDLRPKEWKVLDANWNNVYAFSYNSNFPINGYK